VELWNQRPVYAFSDIHKEASLYTLEQTSPPEAQAILFLNFIMKIPLSSGCGVPPPVGTHSAKNIDATLMEQDEKPPNLAVKTPVSLLNMLCNAHFIIFTALLRVE
jgi:hypothetical protein